MDNKKNKLVYCVIANFSILLMAVVVVICFHDDESKYFRFGPNKELFLISVHIDTWAKWMVAVILISVFKIGDVVVNEIGSPILGFNIYNPDKKHITDFTKNEINILANSMWFINGIRGVLMSVVAITQIDLALCGVLISELTTVFTIRMLLNEKTFGLQNNIENENNVGEEHELLDIAIV
jgi:hypothetical protein